MAKCSHRMVKHLVLVGELHGLLCWQSWRRTPLVSNKLNKSIAGSPRMWSIIQGIYDHNNRIWKARYEVLHSKDDADMIHIRSSEAATIAHYHGRPDLLCTADHHLCSWSLEKLLSSTPSTCHRWLRRVKESHTAHSRDGERQALITSLFT